MASLVVGIASVVIATSANSISAQQNSLVAEQNELVVQQQRVLQAEAALLATQTVLMEEGNRIAASSLQPVITIKYGLQEYSHKDLAGHWQEYVEITNSGSPALEMEVSVLTVAVVSIGAGHATAPSAFTANPTFFYNSFEFSGEMATTGRVGYLVSDDLTTDEVWQAWPANDYQAAAGDLFIDRLHYLHIEYTDMTGAQHEENYLLDRRAPGPERITPEAAAEAARHYADLQATGAYYPGYQLSGDGLLDLWSRYVGNGKGAFYQ
ncbi:MAG: hypothetical protein Q7W51_08365 [Coriobacteriia bacterium]|nr:hypothetical protein [Coriobacteriia bacterium]